jgi:hypothetical protein
MSGTYVNHPEYASYNWTGAPANYALTTSAADGGDSSKTPQAISNMAILKLIPFPYRTREPE